VGQNKASVHWLKRLELDPGAREQPPRQFGDARLVPIDQPGIGVERLAGVQTPLPEAVEELGVERGHHKLVLGLPIERREPECKGVPEAVAGLPRDVSQGLRDLPPTLDRVGEVLCGSEGVPGTPVWKAPAPPVAYLDEEREVEPVRSGLLGSGDAEPDQPSGAGVRDRGDPKDFGAVAARVRIAAQISRTRS
jgi:hypothetical protein